ncbi:NAC domain-containing protein 67-like [Dorcoceras hygrometricum]|uniref:NAC domain-containing protein 67-like n=1 Tax=Dorcoceras hygrometricum TaxID=472368 RepID=A0A2Z7AFN3_9LAMI|nr:NAC domain-containing protein 67-like [Dorcoceras hygrometricum]
MGNTDPNKTKAGNKYEVKPQYEELSKQVNMKHATNQCYECMRLSRASLGGRHSNPVVTTPTIALDFSGTTQEPSSHNVAPNQACSSLLPRAAQFVPQFLNLPNRFSWLNHAVGTSWKLNPKAQKNQLLNLLNETSKSRTSRTFGISQFIAPIFQASINRKSESQGVQRHQERQQQRLDAMEI